MRIAYIDCFSGISGDMILGALLHAGVNLELFRETVTALAVDARLEVEQVARCGISSTKVHVLTSGGELDRAHLFLEEHARHHDSAGVGSAGHAGSRSGGKNRQGHEDHAHHSHGRSLREIQELVTRARIDSGARAMALRAFELLGEAEARVHNVPVEQIHFHEVGAVDAIVDMVCAAVGCMSLGVERWVCSPLNVGGGTVKCAHGEFPVPAPATVELLRGAPVYSAGVQAELVTPTGAAILRALGAEFAGTHNFPDLANVTRILIGESVENRASAASEVVAVIETAVDDMTPQLVGYVMDQLFAAGALDVTVTPVLMKKNRLGHLFTVLCERSHAQALSSLLLRETTTLGVRLREEQRRTSERRFAAVRTSWGEVRVKLGYLNGVLTNIAPEFEDCRRIAEEQKIPLKFVMQEATRLYRESHAAVAD
jgi:pyridinium-3,5-bisthiocarboxylic acid mononucleotide nickel chelatase